MRIAHISDTHLGRRQYNLEQREQDFYDAFNEAIDKIIEERVDILIHSGDLFDSPNPPVKALYTLKNALNRLEGKTKVVTVLGEHDIPKRRAMNPHRLFNMQVLGRFELETVTIDDILIGGISNLKGRYVAHLKQELTKFDPIANNHQKSILVCHQALRRYLPFEGAYELTLDDLPRNANYYALGHIHSRATPIQFGKGLLAYSGSTEITGKDEINSWVTNGKGFYLVDINEEVEQEFIKLDVRPQVDLELDVENLNSLEDHLTFDKKPLMHIALFGEIPDKNRTFLKLQEILKERVIYFKHAFRTSRIREVEVPRGPIEYQTIFTNYFEDEELGRFAYSLYELLANNDIEGATELAQNTLEEREIVE
ncbi:hypothetical protein LCGC14_2278640 [marine sediment metagenome]|uniref:Calcineurin-like phosphoesterase domain-containing protein n=1 Tax=marine sediment metagenome TaxID=412755 RepID=A0A0F9CUS9_9ZZZZ